MGLGDDRSMRALLFGIVAGAIATVIFVALILGH
jgi:hypothetical protein